MRILLLVLSVVFYAVCVAAETAVPAMSESKLRKLSEEGSRAARRTLRWLEEPEQFCSRMRTGQVFCLCGASVLSAKIFLPILQPVLGEMPVLAWLIVFAATAFVLLVLGQQLPQRVSSRKTERTTMRLAGLIALMNGLSVPFERLGGVFSRPLTRLFGCDPDAAEESVTEEEIRMLVDAGEENGSIEESTKDMISNIFDFDDRTVSELMTHRTEVTALEDTVPMEEVVRVAQEEGYSRIPVYRGDIDNVRGILYVKDLLKYVGSGMETVTLESIIRPAYFVPSFKKCGELFTEMTEKKIQMAVVCDEYGGTYGIITMEDLIEAIVGNIQDEYDDEEEEISMIDENRFTIDGGASIDEVADLLGVELPEGDYDTIGGFIVDRLGRIPEEGEQPQVEYRNVTFTVQLIEDRRIAQLLAERMPEEEEDEEE